MLIVLAICLGGLTWTLTEYWLHRGLGHRREAKNPFSVDHLAHHADVSYFSPTYKKVITSLLLTGVLGPPLYLGAGAAGLAGLVGFMAMYLAYEIIHRRLHTHPGRTSYGRWARRHHLYHHFRRPQLNHGVTSPIWDFVFGTLEVPERVKVPRRNAMAWMLDENAELKEEFARDYELVGRGGRRGS